MRAIAAISFACAALVAAFSFPAEAREMAGCMVRFGVSGPICVNPGSTAVEATARAKSRVDPAIHAKVTQHAQRHGVPVEIAHRVVRHESGYRVKVRGKAGEYGLGQIKCATARGEGFAGPCSALLDPDTNLHYSMSYLRKALDAGGVWKYNAGIHARAKPRMSAQYERAVMR